MGMLGRSQWPRPVTAEEDDEMAGATAAGEQRSASPFWTFSLSIYGLPGVPAACLALQDGSGVPVDVNVLLFALYGAKAGRGLDEAAVSAVVSLVEAWRRDVVVPLRQARRTLKEPSGAFDTPVTAALRQRVKAVELEAERLQQETLFAALPLADLGQPATPREAAPANVSTYERVLGARFEPTAVQTLLDAFHSLKD
jgi:uncharacterized protein (TIGR02444 family)